MNTRSNLYRRSALALSSAALTLTVCVAGMPHAAADPYDGDDASEAVSADPGYDAPAEDTGGSDQDNWAGQDVADPGNWDQGGDYSAPEPQDAGSDADAEPAPEPAPAEEAPADEAPADEAPAEEAPDQPDAGADDQQQQDQAPDTDQAQEAGGDDVPVSGTGQESDSADQVDTPDVDTAQVSQDDFNQAQAAEVVTAESQQASASEVQELRTSLEAELSSTSTFTSTSWTSGVTQWNSSWVGYDTYYQPIITNPYRFPLQLVYTYDDATRIINVAPMQRTVLTVPTPGIYSFTALTRDDSGKIANVSTGSFSGGGYVPAAGQQPPTKPATPKTYQNVLVQIHYTNGDSQPFRVKKLTDLGNDAAVGADRVLLDEETPAWGTWSKTQNGERMFEITKTQPLPGLTSPSEAPLPGYDVKLAGSESAHTDSSIDPLVIVAISCGVLGLASVAFFVASARRRNRSQ